MSEGSPYPEKPAGPGRHPARYRAFQFFAALRAGLPGWAGGVGKPLSAVERSRIAPVLSTPAQQQLFAAMPPNDRRHGLAVLGTLQGQGYEHPALLQAALLHDVGKSMGQPIIYRVLIVLFKAFWPPALVRLSAAERGLATAPLLRAGVSRWRRPFVIHARHAAIGAAWAAEAACHPLAVRLIARHQEEPPIGATTLEDKLLAALQWADDLN